jgi:hypothetical protein
MSCVWLCPTHIVLYYLSCLSSSVSCVWLCPTHIVLHYICWTQPYTRHRTTINKRNNTTLYMLDTTIHKTGRRQWLCPTHIVLYYLSCLSSSCVLCMVVSNSYSVVLFVLFVVVLCLVYGCVQLIYCCVIWHYLCWTQPYTRHRRRQTRQITHHYMCWTQPYTRHDDDKQEK